MNNFGLGLVLSFTDNATSGVQRATGAFNGLENSILGLSNAASKNQALLQLSYSAGIIGNELYDVGKSITSVFMQAINTINDTGTSIASARSQLGTLYGSMEAGYAVLDKIKDYSAKSIFNFEDLIPSVIMLKANGIEAFDEIATSAYRATNGVEGVSQTLMDYAADLAAFNPNMHNMYGTGVQAAMGALNEYIAEGNAASLKRGASLDILQLLGEEKGESIEERSRQVADLIEKLGMVGMTANLAGTPMQRLANVEDILFNTLTKISDSGVYEKFTQIVEKFTDYLFNIPDEEIDNLARVIAEAIVEIMDPLEKLVDLLIEGADRVRVFIRENPDFVKNLMKIVATLGTISLIAGMALKVLSTLGMLKFSLSNLFGGNAISRGLVFFGLLKNIFLYIAPLIAEIILLKTAWDSNFLGMQDSLTAFAKETIETFKILFDAITDNTLSEENFQRARELGILPFIEAVLQLKYHLGFLWEGMKRGFDAFATGIGKALVKLGILDVNVHGLRDLFTAIIEKITQPGMTDTWEEVGYWVGRIGGWLLIFMIIIPKIVAVISAVVSVVITIATTLISIINFAIGLYNTLMAIAPVIEFIVNFILAPLVEFLIGGGWIVLLVALGVLLQTALIVIWIAVEVFIITHLKEIATFIKEAFNSIVDFIEEKVMIVVNFLLSVWNNLKTKFPILEKVESTFIKIRNFVVDNVAFLIEYFKKVRDALAEIFPKVKEVVVTAFEAVQRVSRSVANTIGKVFYAAYQIVRTGILAVMVAFKLAKEWIRDNIVTPVAENFYVKYFFKGLKIFISEAVDSFKTGYKDIYNNVFVPVRDFIAGFIDFWVIGFNEIKKFFADFIDSWVMGFNIIKENIIPVIDGIKSYLINNIQVMKDTIMPLLDEIGKAIEWISECLSLGWESVGDFFSGVGDYFKGTGDNLETMLGLSTGGYVTTTGAAVLHPNEVVLNDVLTQRLGNFLEDYDKSYPLQPSTPARLDTPSPIQSFVGGATTTNVNNSDTESNVVFESGSIVFNIDKDTDMANMSEVELTALADKLVRIMARKAQLKQMQTRK